MKEDLYAQADMRMEKSFSALTLALSKIRTGRAHTSLIEHIQVPYYGQKTPLNQVASIVVEDARTLMVTPWEKDLVDAIDKTLRNQDLGLNPVIAGTVIRVPLPPLTEERRLALVKQVKMEAENARVAARHIRRDINQKLKEALKSKLLSEDDLHFEEERIQKLTDQTIAKIDTLLTQKQTDLMQV